MSPLGCGTLDAMDPKAKGEQMCIVVIEQILKGLRALHEVGIVHRDIKPNNIGILKLNPLSIFIFDFDNAYKLLPPAQHITPRRGTVGTRSFLAPEMEEMSYDWKVDLWACGKIGAIILFDDWTNNLLWKDILCITHTVREATNHDRRNPSLPKFQLPIALLPDSSKSSSLNQNWVAVDLLSPTKQNERVDKILPNLTRTIINNNNNSIQSLVRNLLQCDPSDRPSASEALSHSCFDTTTPPDTLFPGVNPPPPGSTSFANENRSKHGLPVDTASNSRQEVIPPAPDSIHTSLQTTSTTKSESSSRIAETTRLIVWERRVHSVQEGYTTRRQALAVGGGEIDYYDEDGDE